VDHALLEVDLHAALVAPAELGVGRRRVAIQSVDSTAVVPTDPLQRHSTQHTPHTTDDRAFVGN
jgi:hypothetical protein